MYFGTLLVACFNLLRFQHYDYVIDDSWISFRIARNFVEHGVLTYNLDDVPVEGMTNLSWTLISALFFYLFPKVDPVFFARILGALFFLLLLVLVYKILTQVAKDNGFENPWYISVCCLVFASSETLAYYAMSGLETPLWSFLYCLGLWVLVKQTQSQNASFSVALGVVLFLLATTRPEGVLVGILVCGSLFIMPQFRRNGIIAGVVFSFFVCLLEAFRWYYYGSLVPNTFYAKPPNTISGLEYIKGFWLYALAIVGPLFALPALKNGAFARIVFSVGISLLLGTVWSGGDWMPGFRRLIVVMVSFYLLLGMASLVVKGRARILVITMMGVCIISNFYMWGSGKFETVKYHHVFMSNLARFATASKEVKSVAIADIGKFGWHFNGPIFDLGGLVDKRIARLKIQENGIRVWDENYFREKKPDVVFIIASNIIDIENVNDSMSIRSFEIPVYLSIKQYGHYYFFNAFHYINNSYLLMFVRNGVQLEKEFWGEKLSNPYFDQKR